jgi:hypothetical protein
MLILGLVITVPVFLPGSAAEAVPLAQFQMGVNGIFTPDMTMPGTNTVSYTNGTGSSAAGTASTSLVPCAIGPGCPLGVKPVAMISGTFTWAGIAPVLTALMADASLKYFFEVIGPPGNVPMILPVNLTTTFTGTGQVPAVSFGSAEAQVYGPENTVLLSASSCLPASECAGPAAISSVLNISVAANATSSIMLRAANTLAVTGSGPLPATFSFSATADPLIHIDPTFVNAGEYTVVYSANLVPQVPEPSALFLLGSGLAGLGAWVRRRRE